METRQRFKTMKDNEGRQRLSDDGDIMASGGPEERTGWWRKCGSFYDDWIFRRIQTDAYAC